MRLSFHIKVRLQKSDNWFAQGIKMYQNFLIFQAKYFEGYENFFGHVSMITQNIVATKLFICTYRILKV